MCGLEAGGFLSLAVALDNCSHSLVGVMTSVIILSLSLDRLPHPLDSNVNLLLDRGQPRALSSFSSGCQRNRGRLAEGWQEEALEELHLLEQAAPTASQGGLRLCHE